MTIPKRFKDKKEQRSRNHIENVEDDDPYENYDFKLVPKPSRPYRPGNNNTNWKPNYANKPKTFLPKQDFRRKT